jgi:hypothetical protein
MEEIARHRRGRKEGSGKERRKERNYNKERDKFCYKSHATEMAALHGMLF